METDESQVSVWVCREEKLVSGLSRRTTCADVVKVLLEEQATLTGGAHTYCIVEKWRGFERVLPNKTKILRLWSAWGDEQENVRFVLVKSDAASLPHNGPRSAEARVVLSRESPCAARAALPYSQEKQRRIVRKAFRKLDKINRKKEEALRDTTSVEKMETLVHLIISQDHTIRQQVQRIKDLDGEIEKCEAKVHVARVKLHGVNYVQDTYLLEQGVEGEEQLEEYAACCERVLQLQEELTEREALMEILTAEIQEELNQRWMKRRQEETPGQDPENITEEPVTVSSDLLAVSSDLQLEEERIKTQLDTSLYIGLRLDTDLETVKSDLDVSRELLDAKEKELRELLEKVHRLDELEEPRGECEEGVEGVEEVWVEQARGLSKTHNSNDEDSDTGLSSMHSQDSDNTPVCESLV